MNIKENYVPFNIKEAIKNPERIRQINSWDKRFIEAIETRYGMGICSCIIIASNGFASPCNTKGEAFGKQFVLTPKLRSTKTVPKTINDLPKRPFWRKYGSGAEAGSYVSYIKIEVSCIEHYIKNGDTYAETFDGPWLPFTKEVECD